MNNSVLTTSNEDFSETLSQLITDSAKIITINKTLPGMGCEHIVDTVVKSLNVNKYLVLNSAHLEVYDLETFLEIKDSFECGKKVVIHFTEFYRASDLVKINMIKLALNHTYLADVTIIISGYDS